MAGLRGSRAAATNLSDGVSHFVVRFWTKIGCKTDMLSSKIVKVG